MTKIDRVSRSPQARTLRTRRGWLVGYTGFVALLLGVGLAAAQTAPATPPATPAPAAAPAAPDAPAAAPDQVVKEGYVVRQSADLGGHIAGISGSRSMYNTLVNIHSGPRVLGQTFTMHALPGTKHAIFDSLTAYSNGFGGDPNNFAKLHFSKGKAYEFDGLFRRDRQYFDYDLLANPNVPLSATVPYGMVAGVATAAALPGRQYMQSPVMFNTVRRMTDTNMTIFPLSKVTFRIGYSQNIFQGPTLSPGRSIGKYDQLLAEYQRNSTDDFTAAIDWKPFNLTKITFEEQVDHYKADSYFTLAPGLLQVQEADGTPGTLGSWYLGVAPYTIAACNTASMGAGYTNATNYTILSAPNTPGGKPIINPACDITTSYLRSQPTRVIYPTEMLRFQSSSIRNIAMNGDGRYTISNSNLANYYENFQGLDGTIRNATFTGNAVAQRRMVSIDYGITWQASRTFALSDSFNFSNLHQPGYANITTGVTENTPALTTGNATINYSGPLVAGTAFTISGNPAGAPLYAYFGQRYVTNNATVSWEPSPRATIAFTYRYQDHAVVQTSGTGPASNLITIEENGGILNLAFRPTNQWKMNGSVEMLYDDNALTPVEPRQSKRYRFHTTYKPLKWATVSGGYNDLERHNNTNNVGATLDGPLQHVDHSRIGSIGVSLAPNEHFGFDVNYSYSDIYTSTNICYFSGASVNQPGTASTNAAGGPNLCPSLLTDWGPTKDFMDAPTQYASFGIDYTPNKKIRTDAGYRISAVSGNQFFANAQQVNGSLQSAYQSPYFKVAWTLHPGLIWKAEYNYYGYGEGGPSGAPFCSTSTGTTAVVVPCNSPTLTGPTGLTESPSGLTAPRNNHANILTLLIHYEF